MTATSLCLNTPPLSLAERRHALIAHRLDLLRRQIDAKNLAAQIGREIAEVEKKLRQIDEARVV